MTATREAAEAASRGHALGLDLSTRMLERASELSDAAGLRNVSYLRADVQVHPFEPASFDIALSLFGSMFFDDPVAAFSNVHNALRPGGRTVLVVWQPLAANEWLLVVRGALAAGREFRIRHKALSGREQRVAGVRLRCLVGHHARNARWR